MRHITFPSGGERSFQELKAWAGLGSILVVYVPYYIYAYRAFAHEPWRGGLMMGRLLETMLIAITLQPVLTLIIQIILSIRTRPGNRDGRDAAIEARSFFRAYQVLSILLLASVTIVPYFFAERSGHITAFPFMTQIIWLSFVVAESTKHLVRALGYRRDASCR